MESDYKFLVRKFLGDGEGTRTLQSGLRKAGAGDAGRARAKLLRGMCLSLEKYLRRGTASPTPAFRRGCEKSAGAGGNRNL